MHNQEVDRELGVLLEEIAACTKVRRDEEVRRYLAASLLSIWAANKLFSPAYPAILMTVMGEEPTSPQVITALACIGEDSWMPEVPDFFREIAERT